MDTSAKNKVVVKNTLMLYFRMFLIMGVTLYTSRIVLEALGEVDYGIYNVVAGVVVMIDFINAALYGATIRFMTYVMDTGDEEERKRTFSSIKFIHLIIGLLTIVLGETIGLWFVMNKLTIPESSMIATFWTYQCSLAVLFISEISLPYSALIMAYEKMSAFAYISILEVLLKLGIAFIILYIYGNKLILYSVLFMLIQIVIRLTYSRYCNRRFIESKQKIRYNKDDIRLIAQFTSWTMLGSVANMGSSQGINILLNIFFGPIINTARGIANQVQVACMKFCTNFQVAVKPQIIKSYSVGELARMHNLMLYSVKLCLFLTIIIVTPIYYFTKPILDFWLVSYPSETIIFIKIILIQQLFYSIGYPLISAIEATGNIKKYQIFTSITTILSLPVTFVALKFWHVSAEWAMLIYLLFTIAAELVRILIVLPCIKLPISEYIRRVVLPSLLPILILCTGYKLIPNNDGLTLPKLLLLTSVVLLGTVAVLYVFGINTKERTLFNQTVGRFLNKLKKQ